LTFSVVGEKELADLGVGVFVFKVGHFDVESVGEDDAGESYLGDGVDVALLRRHGFEVYDWFLAAFDSCRGHGIR